MVVSIFYHHRTECLHFCSRASEAAGRDVSNVSRIHKLAKYRGKTVAMGCAITTKTVSSAEEMNTSLPYFTRLLPSFFKTASPGYFYRFYMGHDFNDTILSTPVGRQVFTKYFHLITTNKSEVDFDVDVQFVQCNHSGKVAWAHNDALMAGYKDGMDYFYMVNDDTIMISNNWTNIYVEQLAQFYPPNVGVVGPDHYGGKTDILTYFFAHRTHVDIFHYFFPRIFVDWFMDDWLTLLYEPHNVIKMQNVHIDHTCEQGTRYKIHREAGFHLKDTVEADRTRLRHYLEKRGVDWPRWSYELTASKTKSNEDVKWNMRDRRKATKPDNFVDRRVVANK